MSHGTLAALSLISIKKYKMKLYWNYVRGNLRVPSFMRLPPRLSLLTVSLRQARFMKKLRRGKTRKLDILIVTNRNKEKRSERRQQADSIWTELFTQLQENIKCLYSVVSSFPLSDIFPPTIYDWENQIFDNCVRMSPAYRVLFLNLYVSVC